MTIDAITNLPQPTDTTAEFSLKAFGVWPQLNTFATQANAMAGEIETALSGATGAAGTASSAASAAGAAAESAEDYANAAQLSAAGVADFAEKYLGSKASDPATNNTGGALTEGALYWNTATKKMRVYNGTAWENAYAPLSNGVTTNGAETLTNKTLVNPTITNYTETRYRPAAAGTAFTLDFANGSIQRFTTAGNLTITLPASVDGKSCTVEVLYGGAHTVTFAGGTTIKYAGGTAPSPTSVAGKIDRYCISQDGAETHISDGGRAI